MIEALVLLHILGKVKTRVMVVFNADSFERLPSCLHGYDEFKSKTEGKHDIV